LADNGKISHEVAIALAEGEYEKYRKEQDKNYISDFDKEIKKISDVRGRNKIARKNSLK
jgi:hypothetical protein